MNQRRRSECGRWSSCQKKGNGKFHVCLFDIGVGDGTAIEFCSLLQSGKWNGRRRGGERGWRHPEIPWNPTSRSFQIKNIGLTQLLLIINRIYYLLLGVRLKFTSSDPRIWYPSMFFTLLPAPWRLALSTLWSPSQDRKMIIILFRCKLRQLKLNIHIFPTE